MNVRSLILVVAAVPIAAFAQALHAQVTTPTASCPGSWSPSMPLHRSAARPVYVERGVVAPFSNGMIALGLPAFFWLGTTHMAPAEALTDTANIRWSFTRSGATFDMSGLADGVPWPDSLRKRSKPRLLGWSENSIQVLWQAIDSVAPVNTSGDPNRLEVMSFDGRGWSAPEIITRERRMPEVDVPAMRAGAPFRHSVVALNVVDSGSFIRVWRRNDNRWIRTQLQLKSFGFHASTTEVSDGSTLVIFTTSIDSPGIPNPDGSRTIPVGVFSARIIWRGDSAVWSPAQFIDTVHAVGGFHAFASARLGADTIVVAWTQRTADPNDRSIATALTADGGRTWTLAKPLVVGEHVGYERLAVDSRGRLHLVYNYSSTSALGASGQTMHALWQHGGWLNPSSVTNADSGQPTVSGTKDGRLVVIWYEATALPDGLMPRSTFAIWTPSSSPGCQP